MKSKEGWKWYGFPGHHCCGSRCQYHLSTNIGNKVLVSTVGRFVPDPLRHPKKTDTVGTGREFETMVFKIDGEDENGDPKVIDWCETLDSDGYNSSIEAIRPRKSPKLRNTRLLVAAAMAMAHAGMVTGKEMR